MATCSAEIDNALNLLKKLIEKRPEDPQHRLRLLTLLHANRRKNEYLEEALRYRAHCDLTFDTGWAKVCEMGREIDPGNGFFGKAPANHNHKPRNGAVRSIKPKPEAATAVRSQTETDSGNDPAPDASPASPASEGTERRNADDRRERDRRNNFSAWFGEERRTYPRRQRKRRETDRDKRR